MNTQVIDIKEIQVKTTSVRKYGSRGYSQFYAYGEVQYNNETIDCGDPFPSSRFPQYEGVYILLLRMEGEKEVSERDFRQCFKGIKNGKELYSIYAERLENNFNVKFI